MKNESIFYTKEEKEIFKNFTTLEEFKQQQKFYKRLFIMDIFIIFSIIMWFIFNFNFWELVSIKYKILLCLIVFFSFAAKKSYDGTKLFKILVAKYESISDTEKNPLINLCNEKITTCKNLILQNQNFITINNHYTDLKKFINDNKHNLPISFFNESIKELETIENELLKCKL